MADVLILSVATGMSTLIGTLTILWFGQPGNRMLAFYLGLSAGIMALMVLVELVPASLDQAPLPYISFGISLGILSMALIHLLIYKKSGHSNDVNHLRLGWMMCLAMALHNFPEGMAIGAGFQAEFEMGVVIALSIALHNVPEGIALAAPFMAARAGKWVIILIAAVISLFIPLGTLANEWITAKTEWGLGFAMAFASGAMGYIVIKEVGPSSYRYHPFFSLLGMAGGLVIMYILHYFH